MKKCFYYSLLILVYFSTLFSCSTPTDTNTFYQGLQTTQSTTNNKTQQQQGQRARTSAQEAPKAADTEELTHNFPKALGYINDFDNILTDIQIEALTQQLKRYEQKTTNQIAVAFIPDLATYKDIHTLATDLLNFWGVGQKEKNNGVLIVFCKKERQVSISTGFGLEKILTNQNCQNIIDNMMTPAFKQDNYYQGISNGINAIIADIEG